MRDSVMGRTEVLDKVKALVLLPDGVHATTEGVADYFVVHNEAIKKLTQRHRTELVCNGLQVLRGSDLRLFERDNLSLSKQSYPQGRAHLTLYTRRTILNIAMLLRAAKSRGRYVRISSTSRSGAASVCHGRRKAGRPWSPSTTASPTSNRRSPTSGPCSATSHR
ncbi:hypothetical protein [Streptomyces rimosus]|uniref:hypothetical protein n=1 Tax=Streptomyces rimosus TaxID=1927 RepID=UPI0018E3E4E2|nr:hypothetical protein [Streptomyces rimosus]